jgi:hypothetical protein
MGKYQSLTHGEGFFRYFFNVLKGGTTGSGAGLARLFITGVSPITMDDVTSGFNIGKNISLARDFNELLGLKEEEVVTLIQYYQHHGLLQGDIEEHLTLLRPWYNHYHFCQETRPTLFHTDMVLYYVDQGISEGLPRDMLDHNVKIDYKKLRHLLTLDKKLNGNFSRLRQIIEEGRITARLKTAFPAEGLLNPENFISLLYFFGLLTIEKEERGQMVLTIPNAAVRNIFYEYLREGYKDVEVFRLDSWHWSNLTRDMAYEGKAEEVLRYLAGEIERQTSVRDYLSGEKMIQGFLLAYLNITDYFLTRSEVEMGKGYVDIYCEPFLAKYPDMGYGYLIELKYLKREGCGKEVIEEALEEAKRQLGRYEADARLRSSLGAARLKKIALIFCGWEMVEYLEIV